MHTRSRHAVCCSRSFLPGLLAFALFATLSSTRAQTTATWINPGTGDWTTAANWDPAAVPSSTDTGVVINNGGTAQLPAADTGFGADDLHVGTTTGGSGAVEVLSGAWAAFPNTYLGEAAGASGSATVQGFLAATSLMNIGVSGTGTLTLDGGTIVSGLTTLGVNAGSHGAVNANSGTLVPLHIAVGDAGTGSLEINSGATVGYSQGGVIGNQDGSIGTVTVNSGGSLLGQLISGFDLVNRTINITVGGFTSNSSLIIGNENGSTGTLDINGGTVTSLLTVLGGEAGSYGEATVRNGGQWQNGVLVVGAGGSAKVTIDGGVVTNGSTRIGPGGSTGLVEVISGTLHNQNGAGGLFGVSDGDLSIQSASNGNSSTLRISGGDVINDGQITVSGESGGTGLIEVTAGTLSTAGALMVQVGVPPPEGGTGTSTVSISGGSMSVAGGAVVGLGPGSATLAISGGSVSIGSSTADFVVGDGTLTQSGGSLATWESTIGGAGTGTARVSGGTWTSSGAIHIGNSDPEFSDSVFGDGTLTIEGTGAVSAPAVTLATNAGDTGTLNIGAYDGTTAGGTLDAASVTFGAGTGAINFNQTNTVTFDANISGAGSVTQRGSGTTLLTGDATHTGGTTISAGTLQIGDGGSTGSIAGDIVDNGALVFDRDNSLTYGGVISGTGSLTQSGAGITTLTGANTYTGATTVNAGTLRAGAAGALPANTSAIVNGGSLDLNNYALTASSLSGTGGLVTLGTATLTVDQAGSAAYAGAITGAGGLTKTGVGTLTLSGSSNFAGLATADGGTLALSGGGTFTTGPGRIAESDGSTAAVTVSGIGTTWAVASDELYAGNVGAGTLTVQDGAAVTSAGYARIGDKAGSTGAVTVTGDGSTWTNTGDILVGNDGAGTLTVANAGLVAATVTHLGNNAGSTGALALDATGASRGTLATGQIVKGAGAGTLVFDGGLLRATASQAVFLSGFSAGQVTLAADGAVIDSNSFNIGIAAPLSGDGGLTKTGAGTLTLSDASAYTGTTAANGGTLSVTGALTTGGLGVGRADGGVTAAVTVAGAGARLDAGSFLTVGDNSGSTGTLTVENGGLVTLSAGAQVTVGWHGATGTLNLNTGGTLEIGGTADGLRQAADGTTTVNLAGGTLRVGDGFTTSVPLTLASTSTLETTAGHATISGALGGAGGLTKTGAGTLTLTGANDYTGATAINAGTLALGAAGTLAHTADINLATGATLDVSAVDGFALGAAQTLAGSGEIVGDVTMAGTLAPGHSPGLMTFAGDLTLVSGSTLLFQLGDGERGVTYDAIDVGGDLTYAGDIEFSLIDGATLAVGDVFQLFDVTGAHTGAFDRIAFADAGLTGDFDYGTGTLTITAVPEVSTYALLAGMGALLLAVWRRRSARAPGGVASS